MITDENEGDIMAILDEDVQGGWLIVDSGATRSVCSVAMLETWQERIAEIFGSAEAVLITDDQPMQFKFGNGETETSLFQMTVPAVLGNTGGCLTIHAIDNDRVPPLMGMDALCALDLQMHFGQREIYFTDASGQSLQLDTRQLGNGHVAVNILGHFGQRQAEQALNSINLVREHHQLSDQPESAEVVEDHE